MGHPNQKNRPSLYYRIRTTPSTCSNYILQLSSYSRLESHQKYGLVQQAWTLSVINYRHTTMVTRRTSSSSLLTHHWWSWEGLDSCRPTRVESYDRHSIVIWCANRLFVAELFRQDHRVNTCRWIWWMMRFHLESVACWPSLKTKGGIVSAACEWIAPGNYTDPLIVIRTPWLFPVSSAPFEILIVRIDLLNGTVYMLKWSAVVTVETDNSIL